MKFNKNLLKEKWVAYTIALCTAVLLYMVLTHLGAIAGILGKLWKVCSPVIMAFVIAFVLDPLVKIYTNYVFNGISSDRLRHNLSVILSFVTVIVFFTILMVALVPQIVDSAVTFAGNLNSYVRSFQGLMRQLNRFALNHDIDLSQFITSSDELLQSITRTLPDNLNKIVNVSYGFGTKLFDWIISIILAVYLMMDGATLKVGFVRLMRVLLPDSVYENTVSVWSRCNKILVQYIAFDILDGMIIGTLNWIFMLIMKMPYVAVVSVIVGVTNLAPTFGPLVGALLGSFILVLANPVAALWFLLFTVILQTVDGYILKPRLFGESLGVSSVWILISLIIGGRLLGVPGILLAIPFAAIGDFLYHDYILNRLEEQKLAQDLLRANIEMTSKKTAAEIAGEISRAASARANAVKAGLLRSKKEEVPDPHPDSDTAAQPGQEDKQRMNPAAGFEEPDATTDPGEADSSTDPDEADSSTDPEEVDSSTNPKEVNSSTDPDKAAEKSSR